MHSIIIFWTKENPLVTSFPKQFDKLWVKEDQTLTISQQVWIINEALTQ